MSGLIVAPDLDLQRVTVQGSIQVEREMAEGLQCNCPLGLPCSGIDINKLPASMRLYELHFRRLGQMFIQRMASRGYQWISGSLHLHGPFLSYEYMERMTSPDADGLRNAPVPDSNGDPHPELSLGYVHERVDTSPFRDYALVGDFLKREQVTEIWSPV